MSEELQQKLRTQLWAVANTLRGNMTAGDFMYFTLGFIFYKYLSEKIELYINDQLSEDGINYKQAWASNDDDLKAEIKRICISLSLSICTHQSSRPSTRRKTFFLSWNAVSRRLRTAP